MAQSLPPVEIAWFECLMSGALPGDVDADGTAKMRSGEFIEWAAKRNKRWVFGDEKVSFLFRGKKTTDGMGFKKDRVDGRQTWFLPSLVECRKAWNAKRFEYDWSLSGDEIWERVSYLEDARPF